MSPNSRIRKSTAEILPVAQLALDSLVAGLKLVLHLLRVASTSPAPAIEDIHKLRVSCRRANVGVRLFRDQISKTQRAWWSKSLRTIRRSANDVRDQDVLAERLAETSAGEDTTWLVENSRAERRRALQEFRQASQRWLETHSIEQEIAVLETQLTVDLAEERNDGVNSSRWAAVRLRDFHRRFRKSNRHPSNNPSRMHFLRIRVKELRYALEVLGEALDPERVIAPLTTLEKLQERLGCINDHRSASRRFRQWRDVATDPEMIDYLDANRRAEKALLRSEQAEFLRWWTPRRIKRLDRRLQRLARSSH